MEGSIPRALIVDDDPALRMMMRVNLELDGFAVPRPERWTRPRNPWPKGTRTSSCSTSISAATTPARLLDALRADGVPVAVVTGSADVNDYRDLADGVLAKPFVPSSLVELARRLARVGP